MTTAIPARASPRNLSGQTMGEKGIRTRRRIVEATLLLLETTRLRDIRVAGIAKRAGISTATFYLYFDDVIDVVLVEVERLSPSTPEILEMVSSQWPPAESADRARRLVEHYVGFWQAHGTLFRVRNLAADEGDRRFVEARERLTQPFLDMLAARVAEAQRSGGVPAPLSPLAVAGVLIAMLERIASTFHVYDDEVITNPQLLEAAAFLTTSTLAGSSH